MAGGVYARVVAVAVAAGAAVLGFPALSGAATAIVRPASRSRRPSMRHPRGHRIRRARNYLPGQSGADVRGRDRQGRHQPDRPDARTAPGRMPPGGRSSFEVRRLRTVVSWPNGKAATSQTCPVRWPTSRPLDARTGRSVPLAHDEPSIDRQRVFGRTNRVPLTPGIALTLRGCPPGWLRGAAGESQACVVAAWPGTRLDVLDGHLPRSDRQPAHRASTPRPYPAMGPRLAHESSVNPA